MSETVSANARRQARFAYRSRESGRKRISVWVTEKQEAKIRAFLKGAQLVKADYQAPVAQAPPKVVVSCEEISGNIIFPDRTVRGPEAVIVAVGCFVRVSLSRFCANTNSFLKGHRFRWSKPCWQRELADPAQAEHRAVEISLRLLRNGCPVVIKDKALQKKVITGDYEPEPSRVLDVNHHEKYGTKFLLSWFPGDNARCSFRPQFLPGAKVFDNAAYVDALHFDCVLDFAEQNGFVITEAAFELINRGQEIRDNTLSIRPHVKTAPVAAVKPAPRVAATGEIDAELADI